MQIHEITKKSKLDEAVADTLGYMGGKTVSGVKNVGGAIAAPFKDIAQGYTQGRMDQRTAKLADRMYRAWQNYSVQWAKSQGGQYTAPGKGGAAQQPAAGQQAGQAPTTQAGTTKKATGGAVDQQTLYATMQSLDNKTLNAVAKILSQKVGPEATMNALKTPEPTAPMTEAQLNELGWQDVKAGAQKFGAGVKSAYQTATPYVKQAAKAGMKAVKAAPGAIATAAGGTAGAIAGMPARAGTAYRGAKASVGGPKMTTQELQLALAKLTTAQAKKLFAFVQQIQAARKAGLKEGVTPDTLLPSYEQALKAFVQKNMLAGMQYSRLQNVSQIDGLIKQIVNAQNDSDSAQRDLWNKLTLAAGVAQHNAAGSPSGGQDAAGDAAAPGGQKQAGSGDTEDAYAIKDQMVPILKQLGQDKNVATVGSAVRKTFTNSATDIKSTGVPAVDAMLMTMGFDPQ
jgi:hypothetical protein